MTRSGTCCLFMELVDREFRYFEYFNIFRWIFYYVIVGDVIWKCNCGGWLGIIAWINCSGSSV